ncbi:MAG: nucleotidyltransferase domain-containing protein [Candidatus Methanomethylophilaceae archaeon]|nr:nucleotidyltransferase domain-containing protein [Candidatus Methanomethylophilaceae archaeon]
MDAQPGFEELSAMVSGIARRYGIRRVILFGSRARGDSGPGSDYDFCITPSEGTSVFEMGGFLTDMEEELGCGVDVVSDRNLDPGLAGRILRDGRLLYEA